MSSPSAQYSVEGLARVGAVKVEPPSSEGSRTSPASRSSRRSDDLGRNDRFERGKHLRRKDEQGGAENTQLQEGATVEESRRNVVRFLKERMSPPLLFP